MRMAARYVVIADILRAVKRHIEWYFNLNNKDIVIKIINLALKKYKVDYNHIIKNPIIEGKMWFNYYTFDSEKEYYDWKNKSKKIIKKYHPDWTDNNIQREMSWIDVAYGLRCTFKL